MRIYVASQHNNREATRAAQTKFVAAGHTITHDWTACELSQHPEQERNQRLTEFAEADLKGVRDCDACVVLAHPGMSATLSEMGMAIALRKIVIVVDCEKDGCPFNVFYYLPSVQHVFSVDDAVFALGQHMTPVVPVAPTVDEFVGQLRLVEAEALRHEMATDVRVCVAVPGEFTTTRIAVLGGAMRLTGSEGDFIVISARPIGMPLEGVAGTVEPMRAPRPANPSPVTDPVTVTTDRYALGDATRRAFLARGRDSWLTIADDVLAELAKPVVVVRLSRHED